MPVTEHKLRVFLSYAKEDFISVHEMYNRLKDEGWIEPWQDKTELLPGEHWTAAIKRAIDLADAVIIFLSDNSINKEGFVHYEMNYAWDRSLQKPPGTIYRIPIRLDDCDVPEDLYELDSRQWVDYFDTKKEETYKKILLALKQRLEQKEKLEARENARTEKLAKKKTEEEAEREKLRLDTEKAEQARIAREKREKEQAEREKLRLDAEKAEQARIAREKGLRKTEEIESKEMLYVFNGKNKNHISSSSSNKRTNISGIVLTVFAVIFFGIPGIFLSIFGAVTATGNMPYNTEVNGISNSGMLPASAGIGMLCFSLLFILIPVGVGFFTLLKKPAAVVSNDEPLPPTS